MMASKGTLDVLGLTGQWRRVLGWERPAQGGTGWRGDSGVGLVRSR